MGNWCKSCIPKAGGRGLKEWGDPPFLDISNNIGTILYERLLIG